MSAPKKPARPGLETGWAPGRDSRFFYRFLLAGRGILSMFPPLPPPFILAALLILLRLIRVDVVRFLDQYNQGDKDLMDVEEGDAFIDVGASLGAWTLWASRKVGMNGKVIAIEPNALAYAWLARNSKGLRNIALVHAAAHSSAGTISIWSVNNSMSSTEDKEVVGHFMPLMSRGRLIAVRAMTLDSLRTHLKPDQDVVLKIDVEGAEFEVLRGAASILPRVKMAIVETHSDSLRALVEDFLGRNGFGTRYSHRNVFARKLGSEVPPKRLESTIEG